MELPTSAPERAGFLPEVTLWLLLTLLNHVKSRAG